MGRRGSPRKRRKHRCGVFVTAVPLRAAHAWTRHALTWSVPWQVALSGKRWTIEITAWGAWFFARLGGAVSDAGGFLDDGPLRIGYPLPVALRCCGFLLSHIRVLFLWPLGVWHPAAALRGGNVLFSLSFLP